MQAKWDESFLDSQQQYAPVYWVCFWTGDDVEQATQHDPQRVTGAESVEEVLAWVALEKGERRFELFVETVDRVESRAQGWTAQRSLIRLAGDFRAGSTTVTVTLIQPD